MQVKINFLASLRHYNNGEEIKILELEPDMKIKKLISFLNLPKGEIMQVVIEGRKKGNDETIGVCNEIFIFPILSGG
ncbi:MAG: hypothetical protein AB1765_00505 [Candidatus Hydrogenedentota bacterium]